MKLAEFAEIETPRLWLRPAKFSDAADVLAFSQDLENLRYVYAPQFSLEETQIFLLRHFIKAPLGNWLLQSKADGRVIGLLHFTQLKLKTGTVEFGYLLRADNRQQGLMTETLQTLIDFIFREFGLKEILLQIDPQNLASRLLAEKCGFQKVGQVKAKHQETGQLREFYQYLLDKKAYFMKMERN